MQNNMQIKFCSHHLGTQHHQTHPNLSDLVMLRFCRCSRRDSTCLAPITLRSARSDCTPVQIIGEQHRQHTSWLHISQQNNRRPMTPRLQRSDCTLVVGATI
jgi:hypothetical protein